MHWQRVAERCCQSRNRKVMRWSGRCVVQARYDLLHSAVADNNLSVVLELLRREPGRVHARNRLGETPLHIAVARSSQKIITALCSTGADVNALKNVSEQAP